MSCQASGRLLEAIDISFKFQVAASTLSVSAEQRRRGRYEMIRILRDYGQFFDSLTRMHGAEEGVEVIQGSE